MKELGYAPKIGWQIDPFGHSLTNARVMAESGLEAIFLARINWKDREQRRKYKELEFIWRPFFSYLGTDA